MTKLLAIAGAWPSGEAGDGEDLASLNRGLCAALAKLGVRVDCLVPRATAREIAEAQGLGVGLVIADGGDLHRPPAWSDGVEADVVLGYGTLTGDAALIQAGHSSRTRRVHVALADEPADLALAESADVPAAVGAPRARALASSAAITKAVWSIVPGLPAPADASSLTTPAAWRCVAVGDLSSFEGSGLDILAQALAIVSRSQLKAKEAGEEVAPIELVLRTTQPGFADLVRDRMIASVDLGASREILDVKVVDPGAEGRRSLRDDLREAALFVLPQSTGDFGLSALDAIALAVPTLVSASSGLAEVLLEKAPPLAALHIVGVHRNMSQDATAWSSRMSEELMNREAAFARARRLRFALAELGWESAARSLLDRLSTDQGHEGAHVLALREHAPASRSPAQAKAAARDQACEAALGAFEAATRSKDPAAIGATLSLLVSWFEQFEAFDDLYPRWEKIEHVFRHGVDLSLFGRGGEGTEALAVTTAKTMFYRQRDLSNDDRLELLDRVRALLKPTQYYAVAKIDLERAELLAGLDDPSAITLCHDAVSAAEQMQDPWFLGLALMSQTTVLARLKKYKEAREVADRALSIFGERNQRHASAIMQRLKAEISLGQEPRDIVGASVYTAEALAGFQATKDSVGEAQTLLCRAEVLFGRNKPDDALAQFDRAVKLLEVAGLRTQQGRALLRRAHYHTGRNNERQALRDLEQASLYLAESPERHLRAQVLISQGDAHLRLGDHTWIVDHLDEIEQIAMSLKPTVKAAALLTQLCGLAKALPVPDKPRIRRLAIYVLGIGKGLENKDVETWARTFLAFAG